jgi:type VI protein secretion system component Hcp
MKKLSLVLALLCLVAVKAKAADTVSMTTNNQIKCTGQSSNSITLTGWSWGSAAPVSSSALGIVIGKVNPSQITLNKVFDPCSTPMLTIYFNDGRLGTVVIEQYKSNGINTLPVAEVTLTNAYIASYSVGGTSSSPASETWTLSFDKVCVTTYGVTPTGASQAGTTACYGAS